MAIFRCNKCGYLKEIGAEYLGKQVPCPKCETVNPVRDTVAVISYLIKLVMEQKTAAATTQTKSATAQTPTTNEHLLANIDVANTDVLMSNSNIVALEQWFKAKGIEATIDQDELNTTGFFDEVGEYIGDHFDVAGPICNQIKYIQNKSYETVKVELAGLKKNQSKAIEAFCRKLHEYSFVAKVFHKKPENALLLTIQSAQSIKQFFNGHWMEWYAFIKLLKFFAEQKNLKACARAIEIRSNDGQKNEIDLFALTKNDVPILIECKTGEFRTEIDKMQNLRKRLGINKRNFIVCVFGLDAEQAKGLTAMYDISFVNERQLIEHLTTIA